MKKHLPYPIFLFLLVSSMIFSACASDSRPPEAPDIREFLREIPYSVASNSVFRENILEERGIHPLDSTWYRPLGLHRIPDIDPSDNLYPLGKLPVSFGGQQCLLLLQDRPHQSRAWLINFDDRGQYRDHLLVFDLAQPKKLNRWSYLQTETLEVYTNRDTIIYGLGSEGEFRVAR